MVKQIEIFTEDSTVKLKSSVNQFLYSLEYSEIIDVKYFESVDSKGWSCTCLILYYAK
jgi:hypothetical protein